MKENFSSQPLSSMEFMEPDSDTSVEEEREIIKQAEFLRINNPDFAKIFEDECLTFLKTKDSEWFCKNYNGERDDRGYLIDKDGKQTALLPSQNITSGLAEVSKSALERFSLTQKD